MQDGWFVAILILALVAFGGTAFGFWMIRLVAQRKESETLSAADLRLLEESVEALIARLKAASEEAVAEMSARQRSLEGLLDRVDAALPAAREAQTVARLLGEGVPEVEAARSAGLTRAEMDLLLEVRAARQ